MQFLLSAKQSYLFEFSTLLILVNCREICLNRVEHSPTAVTTPATKGLQDPKNSTM